MISFRIYVTTVVNCRQSVIIAVFLFFSYFIQLCDSRTILYLTREFRVKPISHSSLRDSYDIGFRVQFNAEFPSQVMNFRI